MRESLEIIQFSSEISPYSKTGGLADVVRSLPRSLKRMGHRVSVITPLYKFIKDRNLPLEDIGIRTEVDFAGHTYRFRYYKITTPDKYPVFFINHSTVFNVGERIYNYPDNSLRFVLFNLAALELIKKLKWKADVLHSHEWQSGLIANFIKTRYRNDFFLYQQPTVFTIHNLNFQGSFNWWEVPPEKKDKGRGDVPEDKEAIPWINFAKRAIIYSDVINAVSERYAKEILTPEFGCGLDKYLRARRKTVFGIINGIDYHVFNPSYDKHIYINYGVDSLKDKVKNKVLLQKEYNLEVNQHLPLIGLANRLSEQKGFELIVKILDSLLKKPLQIAVIGSGDKSYIDAFRRAKEKYPKKILFITPFREDLSRKIYAASDIYLMPSRFEPCGISQLISLRYGSIPIVHKVGGLVDTIKDYNPITGKGNGFVFKTYTSEDLLFTIGRALEDYRHRKEWRNLVKKAMRESYSWMLPAQKYVALYRRAIKIREEKLASMKKKQEKINN